MNCGAHHWTVASLATGAVALVALLLAVSTSHWIYMSEECSVTTQIENETMQINYTVTWWAGLWQLCFPTSQNVKCIDTRISNGLNHNKQEDQMKSGAVAEVTKIQLPFTCTAVLLTLIGFTLSIVGNFRKDKKTIMAAVMYILSGLCLAMGVILYISRIDDELGNTSKEQCHSFQYSYGWSFYLIGVSFVVEESSAVISIKLFLARNIHRLDDMVSIIPGLEDKIYIKSESAADNNSQTLIW